MECCELSIPSLKRWSLHNYPLQLLVQLVQHPPATLFTMETKIQIQFVWPAYQILKCRKPVLVHQLHNGNMKGLGGIKFPRANTTFLKRKKRKQSYKEWGLIKSCSPNY